MPIFDYSCSDCGNVWESVETNSNHAPTKCPKCESTNFAKCFSSLGRQQIRMDSDAVKHNLPDPAPPLEELRGKGSEGYKDKPYADTNLNNYTRSRDKHGNTLWKEKRKTYFHPGMGSHKSSAERGD